MSSRDSYGSFYYSDLSDLSNNSTFLVNTALLTCTFTCNYFRQLYNVAERRQQRRPLPPLLHAGSIHLRGESMIFLITSSCLKSDFISRVIQFFFCSPREQQKSFESQDLYIYVVNNHSNRSRAGSETWFWCRAYDHQHAR